MKNTAICWQKPVVSIFWVWDCPEPSQYIGKPPKPYWVKLGKVRPCCTGTSGKGTYVKLVYFSFCFQVLMLIDASFGFEMETFEFLNICQVHGFPRIMGVLTHLDSFKNNKTLRKTKKKLKHRFWTEVYQVNTLAILYCWRLFFFFLLYSESDSPHSFYYPF